jgi:cardiolipin synthase
LAVRALFLATYLWQTDSQRQANPEKERCMPTNYTLYTQVEPFYTNLVSTLDTAQEAISLLYYAFDGGDWADRISQILADKAANGVQVRLMIDEFGLVLEEPRNALRNQARVLALRAAGVQVDLFRPTGNRLHALNRLHFKVCAIDHQVAFIGGSNISDHYLEWDDANLRLDGNLGDIFHRLYDFVNNFSAEGAQAPRPHLHLSKLIAGDAQVWLTVPKQRSDIRRALLDLILEAEEAIYIRNWYFLPDQEIMNALRTQAENGVKVHVLLSHRTRVKPVDIANYIHGHKLAKSGGQVYRYTEKYMHAKVAWNDTGKVLFGSANMDEKALHGNFECSLTFHDPNLTTELRLGFEADQHKSIRQTPELFRRRSLTQKSLSYACNLAASWL